LRPVPRDSIGRRVARAASIGGSRSYGSRTPYGWYAIVLAVCVIGLGLIVLSRHERLQAAANPSTTTSTTTPNNTPPTISDHWQVALAVDACGHVENLPKSSDQTAGIITPGNGVVDIQPARAGSNAAKYEGANATLGKFLSSEGVILTNTSLRLPSSLGKLAGVYHNGRRCGSKPGRVDVFIWGSPSASKPFPATNTIGIPYGNGEMFMVSFVPKGASIPRPPAQHLVAAFLKSQTTTTTTTAPAGPTTTAPAGPTTTSPVTSTTKAPGTTSTTG